jgi:AcrR family transcriptional regulator
VRTGRRPGTRDTRGAILQAARRQFAQLGYEGATIRAIAARAGVDPALVLHYFESKEGLFVAAMELPFRPSDVLPPLLELGTDGLGERLVRLFLQVLNHPHSALEGLLRAAASNPRAAAMLRGFVTREVIGRVAAALEVDRPELRASLAGSQMVGLAMLRTIIRVRPLAEADQEVLVRAVGPVVQRYLTEDLG